MTCRAVPHNRARRATAMAGFETNRFIIEAARIPIRTPEKVFFDITTAIGPLIDAHLCNSEKMALYQHFVTRGWYTRERALDRVIFPLAERDHLKRVFEVLDWMAPPLTPRLFDELGRWMASAFVQ